MSGTGGELTWLELHLAYEKSLRESNGRTTRRAAFEVPIAESRFDDYFDISEGLIEVEHFDMADFIDPALLEDGVRPPEPLSKSCWLTSGGERPATARPSNSWSWSRRQEVLWVPSRWLRPQCAGCTEGSPNVLDASRRCPSGQLPSSPLLS